MIRAYVLIQTQVGEAVQVAREVSTLDGVTSAEAVTGPYDVVAQAEAADLDRLGRLVAAEIHGVGGISRTITCAVVAL